MKSTGKKEFDALDIHVGFAMFDEGGCRDAF